MADTTLKRNDFLRVLSVDAGLAAANAGMKKGDIVVSVDGRAVTDELDFRFNTACDVSRVVVRRNGMVRELTMNRSGNAASGINFVQRAVGRCANRCVFCFIDQMPKGLRKSLYVKDEDIGHSFTNGNYVTLSNTPYEELERVASLGLSPLYVSVHATDDDVRRRMLGNCRAFGVMDQLRFLAKNGISFHTQIVVCPGYNDGAVLRGSIRGILSLGQHLLSIAIVPVGLTKYRKEPLVPVTAEEARALVSSVSKASEKDRLKQGRRRLFCADELFIKAGMPIPPRSYYEDYPQIENGVGLVRQLLEEWKKIKRRIRSHGHVAAAKRKATDGNRILIVTSESAAGFLMGIASDMERLFSGLSVQVVPVKNEFFGDRVTVAGLCTGHDILRAVRKRAGRWDRVVIPDVVFNFRGYTLDGYSALRLEKALGMPVSSVGSLGTLMSFF